MAWLSALSAEHDRLRLHAFAVRKQLELVAASAGQRERTGVQHHFERATVALYRDLLSAG